MRYATRIALAAFAFVLWSGPAAAQNDVTFQVNLQPFITSCQFTPGTNNVFVRGSFNDFSTANQLTAAGNGVYTGTVPIAAGPITYKFYTSNEAVLGWENGSDRAYTVTAGAQTVPVVDFNKDVVNACGGVEKRYDIRFRVDMNVQIGRGAFNPQTQRVAAAGSFVNGGLEGWDGASAFPLLESSIDPGVYTGTLRDVPITVPTTGGTKFKFVIVDGTSNVITTFEGPRAAVTPTQGGGDGGDRLLTLTGNETGVVTYDNDGNANTEVFFSDADASQFLTDAATVTFNVDLRSAQYRLAASGALPAGPGSDPSTGNTAISGLWINGPAAGESRQDAGPGGGIGDWADWGNTLAAQTGRKLEDPDGDGIYTLTLNYDPGARKNLVAKFGVGGADNESGFGGDHNFPIVAGASTYNLSFGCVRQSSGRFVDQTGSNPEFNAYDEFLLIRNDLSTPTCVTTRSGGVAGDVNTPVAVENGPEISGLDISAAYPNPLRGSGRIDLTLNRAMTVSARVYDVTGRTVATLLDGRDVAAGKTTVDLDVSRLAAGVYVLRIEADGQVASRRMTITR